jgi:hypothetical protein
MLKLLETADSQLLKDFIDQILHNDPTVPTSTTTALNWYLTKLTESAIGCYYFAELENDKIIKVLFTMTVSSMFRSVVKVYPFWIVGFVYSFQHNSTPIVTIGQLVESAISHYEAMGYTTFFSVNTVPSHYSHRQINKFIAQAITPSVRYDYHVDAVIDDPANYDDFLLFKMIIPKQIPDNKSVLIIRGDLKHEFRNFNK